MDNNVIFHDHDGNIIELEGDTWPSENIDVIEPTNEQLREEIERDVDNVFFQYNRDYLDTCIETLASVNVNLDTVFCASVTDTILIENVVPSNDDVAMLNNDTRTISIAEPAPPPTD